MGHDIERLTVHYNWPTGRCRSGIKAAEMTIEFRERHRLFLSMTEEKVMLREMFNRAGKQLRIKWMEGEL
jgi:hypothetical protein